MRHFVPQSDLFLQKIDTKSVKTIIKFWPQNIFNDKKTKFRSSRSTSRPTSNWCAQRNDIFYSSEVNILNQLGETSINYDIRKRETKDETVDHQIKQKKILKCDGNRVFERRSLRYSEKLL